MKYLLLVYVIIYVLAATCPNMCSGHGTCTKSGTCVCHPGFMTGDCSQRTCPYNHPYTDPTAKTNGNNRIDLECSSQGNCDRTTGLCECYPGYQGAACQRTECPNSCSGHGVCTTVRVLDINEKAEYVLGGHDLENYYTHWDKEQSYACVCDPEYEGYDCSDKKCPSGYLPSSDCDAAPQEIQTIIFKELGEHAWAYAEYEDSFGRRWYTSKCDLTSKKEENNSLYAVLNRLPTGILNIDDTNYDKDTFSITFGKHQTGRQNPILLHGYNDVIALAPGIHGLSQADLLVEGNTLCTGYSDSYDDHYPLHEVNKSGNCKGYVSGYESTDTVTALPCSRNGKCDTVTGLCDCFTGYYGLACTEQTALI